jgi:hypothetical protein
MVNMEHGAMTTPIEIRPCLPHQVRLLESRAEGIVEEPNRRMLAART